MDAFCVHWCCIVEVVDEKGMNLRPCSGVADTDIQRLSKAASDILKSKSDFDCVRDLFATERFVL